MITKKVTEYPFQHDVWKGNVVEEGEFISDGVIVLSVGHIRHSKLDLLPILAKRPENQPQPTVSQEQAWKLLQMRFERELKPFGAVEANRLRTGHVPYYFMAAGKSLAVDVTLLRFVCELVKTDKAVTTLYQHTVGFRKGDEVVAAIAPLLGVPELKPEDIK